MLDQKIIYIFVISLFVSSISIILRPLARYIGLLDKPSSRKFHSGNIPLIGGLSVFIAICISCFEFRVNDIYLEFIISGFILLLGIIDDFNPLSPK